MNTASIRDLLESYLSRGGFLIGQIQVSAKFELRHVSDVGLSELEVHSSPQAARQLAVYDDAGKYRPLKSAPNLCRGWLLKLASVSELHLALDAFYPAALGTWLASLQKRLDPVPLRETLGRQTGMYRVVGLLTDEQTPGLIQACCAQPTCLRRVLWEIEPGKPSVETELTEFLLLRDNEIPLLCVEACNLLIAEGRKVVKAAQK